MNPNSLFNTTISTKRATTTKDSGGSPISTYAIIGSYSARVQPLSGNEPVIGGRRYTMPAYNVYIDADVDILMTDTVTYGDTEFQVVEKIVYPNTYCKLVIEATN